MPISSSKPYKVWQGIKQRCYNKNAPSYRYYGARGISMHPDFLDFNRFSSYMAQFENFTKPGYAIDRIDSDRGYEPGNIQVITKSENSKRTNRIISIKEAFKPGSIHKTIQVISTVGYTDKRGTKHRCVCLVCGKEQLVYSSVIRKGNCQVCSGRDIKIDYSVLNNTTVGVGYSYSGFTVIDNTPIKSSKRTCLLCKCDKCGNEVKQPKTALLGMAKLKCCYVCYNNAQKEAKRLAEGAAKSQTTALA
jgi:hypothetical protein